MDNGLFAWETNAQYWDDKMGDESNNTHRNLVRPRTEELLDVKKGDFILDIACGNGNFSKRLADNGARVVAFDFSPKMIELAKVRRKDALDKISFTVCDAIDFDALMMLKQERPYDKAVANMAIMDISNIQPLFRAVSLMLRKCGSFVFSTLHPCFDYPNNDYLTNCIYKGEAIAGQPVLQNYYHRTIEEIFSVAFQHGFIVDGFYEVPKNEQQTPFIVIVRMRMV